MANSSDSENVVAKRVRLALQALRCTLFRNNVGAYQTDEGRWIFYGLCKGSSDYIGWTEHVIRPEDVGRKVAIFTAAETKAKYGVKRKEQETFILAVERAGGIGGFVRDELEARSLVITWKNWRAKK